jgi:hypothetical protein
MNNDEYRLVISMRNSMYRTYTVQLDFVEMERFNLAERVEDRPALMRWELWQPNLYKLQTLQFAVEFFKVDVVEEKRDSRKELAMLLNKAKIPRVLEDELIKIQKGGSLETGPDAKEAELIRTWAPDPLSPDFKAADPFSYAIDFSKVRYYQYIAGGLGSSGICVVDIEDSGVLVVKEAKAVWADLLASSIGRRLASHPKFCTGGNNPCWIMPGVRSLSWGTPQFNALIDSLEKLEFIRTEGTGSDLPKIHRMKNTNDLLIMKYIVGTGIFELSDDPTEAAQIFSPKVLRSIGKSLVFDMLINNWDRIPAIWSNEGNGSNLMFSLAKGENASGKVINVVLIDQAVMVIKGEDQVQDYFDSISDFVARAAQDYRFVQEKNSLPSGKFSSLSVVRDFILKNTSTAHDIGPEGDLEVLLGFCDAVESISNSENGILSEAILKEIEGDAQRKLDAEVEQMQAFGEIKHCIKFVNGALDAFRRGWSKST